MTSLAGARAIARDPVLRLAVLTLLCWGVVSASVAPYQSLIAIRLFRFSPTAYAAILICAALVAVSSSVAAGLLADQRARRRRIALALAIAMVAGLALMRLAPAAPSFALTHALLLPLSAGLYGQVFALVRIASGSRPPAERERISALTRAAVSLPYVSVLPIWSLAVRAGVPLLAVYSLGLVAGLIALALIVRHWPDDAALPQNRRSGLSFRASLGELAHPAVLARIAALGLAVSGVYLYLTLLGPMFTAAGRNEGLVALFAGVVAGLEIPSMMIGASLLARWSKTRVICLGASVHAAFMLAFAASAHFGPVLLLTIPAGFGAGLLLTIPIGYVQDLLGHRPGAGGALIAVHQFLTAAFGALAFLIGTQTGGYAEAAVAGALFTLTGAGLLMTLDRRPKAPAATQGASASDLPVEEALRRLPE